MWEKTWTKTNNNTNKKARSFADLASKDIKKAKEKKQTEPKTTNKTVIIDTTNNWKKKVAQPHTSKKIPILIWLFFWCSLWIFLVVVYKTILLPKINNELENSNQWTIVDLSVNTNQTGESSSWNLTIPITDNKETTDNKEQKENKDSETTLFSLDTETLKQSEKELKEEYQIVFDFYKFISQKDLDQVKKLCATSILNSKDSLFLLENRNKDFVSLIKEDILTPKEIKMKEISDDVIQYEYKIQYSLNEKAREERSFEETREMRVNTKTNKIFYLYCTTKNCSYHPFFRPETFKKRNS